MKEYATPFSMLHAVSLLSHKSRLDKFNRAIKATVSEGDIVIDLGTGSGVLALMAARAGASKVFALDLNRESLFYAEKAAKLNGFHDKIEFIHGHYSQYKPKSRADVVICEMLSSMMLIEQQVQASHHAVVHFLKPEGILLPKNVRIFITPVNAAVVAERFFAADFRFPQVPQTASKDQFCELSDFQQVAEFQLNTQEPVCAVDTILKFNILTDSVVHGFAGVFESTLTDKIVLQMEDGWRDLILPLDEPREVSKGDKLVVRISFIPGQFDSLILELLS